MLYFNDDVLVLCVDSNNKAKNNFKIRKNILIVGINTN